MVDYKGINVKIVSDEEAEKSDYLVCVREKDNHSPFTDNLVGVCCQCNEPVIFRPHAPKKPPKLCMDCLLTIEKAGGMN